MRREHDNGRRRCRGDDVEPVIVDRLLDDVETKLSKVAGKPAARLTFASSRGVDVDEPTRQLNEVDAGTNYLIHASSSVRVSVRESRYFTITGVASDSPQSAPLPTVTARAPGTTSR